MDWQRVFQLRQNHRHRGGQAGRWSPLPFSLYLSLSIWNKEREGSGYLNSYRGETAFQDSGTSLEQEWNSRT